MLSCAIWPAYCLARFYCYCIDFSTAFIIARLSSTSVCLSAKLTNSFLRLSPSTTIYTGLRHSSSASDPANLKETKVLRKSRSSRRPCVLGKCCVIRFNLPYKYGSIDTSSKSCCVRNLQSSSSSLILGCAVISLRKLFRFVFLSFKNASSCLTSEVRLVTASGNGGIESPWYSSTSFRARYKFLKSL